MQMLLTLLLLLLSLLFLEGTGMVVGCNKYSFIIFSEL